MDDEMKFWFQERILSGERNVFNKIQTPTSKNTLNGIKYI